MKMPRFNFGDKVITVLGIKFTVGSISKNPGDDNYVYGVDFQSQHYDESHLIINRNVEFETVWYRDVQTHLVYPYSDAGLEQFVGKKTKVTIEEIP